MKQLYLKGKNGCILFQDVNTSKLFIAKPTINPVEEKISRDNFILYRKSLSSDYPGIFEVLEFSQENPEMVDGMFDLISSSSKPIFKLMEDIEDFFQRDAKLSLELIRGIFAELIAMELDGELIANHQNAIYDFSKNGVDVEVKSISRVKTTIKISLQQLTNSDSFEVRWFEIGESSEGDTVKQLLLKQKVVPQRFSWILKNDSKIINTKFKVYKSGNVNMEGFSKKISTPDEVIDATFDVIIKK